MRGRGARSSPLYGSRMRTLRACGYSACCFVGEYATQMIRVVSKSGLSFFCEGSDNSQEEEMEDKVQGYRTKVEECSEYPPWLANVTE